jgi:hypothetical protein
MLGMLRLQMSIINDNVERMFMCILRLSRPACYSLLWTHVLCTLRLSKPTCYPLLWMHAPCAPCGSPGRLAIHSCECMFWALLIVVKTCSLPWEVKILISSCSSPSGSILGASNSTVLAKEFWVERIMYQDVVITPAGSSSSFHHQHQLQYSHPCHLSNPAHQHHPPT